VESGRPGALLLGQPTNSRGMTSTRGSQRSPSSQRLLASCFSKILYVNNDPIIVTTRRCLSVLFPPPRSLLRTRL
jgi:hypothetical protein